MQIIMLLKGWSRCHEVIDALNDPTDKNITTAINYVDEISSSEDYDELKLLPYSERLMMKKMGWRYTTLLVMERICKS